MEYAVYLSAKEGDIHTVCELKIGEDAVSTGFECKKRAGRTNWETETE